MDSHSNKQDNSHTHEHEHKHDDHDHSHSHSHNDKHSHNHAHHDHHKVTMGNRKGLTIALSITIAIMLLELMGGLFTGSLALLSDSGHMLSDCASLLLSLIAFWLATKPASPQKSFGFHRFEILAALFNGILLFIVSGFILWEAYHRLFNPPIVNSGIMMMIAAIGLIANFLSAKALLNNGDVHHNLNLKSAYIHILSDALGSLGAIAAGVLMYCFSWYIADPMISIVVALLILKSAWSIVTHTIHILMEGTPGSIDSNDVRKTLEQIPGVADVHDLHIWTITSGLISLSCHLLIEDSYDGSQILQQAIEIIESEFVIKHTTIQIDTSAIRHGGMII